MVSELIIGARGWQYSQWITRFYPDDMPDDWRFSYYSNEFNSVLLPQAELLAAEEDAVKDWYDDIGEDFVFFVELDELQYWQDCLARLTPLRSLIGGFVLHASMWSADDLAQCVVGIKEWAPVCVDERMVASDESVLQIVQQHQLGCCWNAQHDAPAWREGVLSVALLEGGFDYEPRQLREILENCLRNTRGKSSRALFITGHTGTTKDNILEENAGSMAEAPSIDTLRQAIQLRDLIE